MSWGLIGHQWAEDLLKGHIIINRVRHAYLITGTEGIGKRTLALRFLQALTCQHPPREGGYCNECRSCQLIPQNAYPDLHLVDVEENERSIKVDKIRSLRRVLSLSPNEGKRRLALLVDFHNATEQAANALLKTLEEPPPQVVIILTAKSREALLPTIVSRCENISLRPITTKKLSAYLISLGETAERARLLAGVAGGRPGWAIRLREDPTVLDRRDRLLDEMIGLIAGDRQKRFSYVEEWNTSLRKRFPILEDRRKECMDVLGIWLAYWRDVMLQAYGGREPRNNPNREDAIRIHVDEIPKNRILMAIESIQNTIDAIDRNANIRLVLETLMLDLPYCESD
jgi:DNA polymerase-3 subunit delta'